MPQAVLVNQCGLPVYAQPLAITEKLYATIMASITMRKVVHRYTKDDYVFVYQMLRLRSEGWSYVKIGEMFNKHHSTIIHWCKRFKVDINKDFPELDELDHILNKKPVPNQYKYKQLIDEPINRGKKSYAEYLKESDMLRFKKHINPHNRYT